MKTKSKLVAKKEKVIAHLSIKDPATMKGCCREDIIKWFHGQAVFIENNYHKLSSTYTAKYTTYS